MDKAAKWILIALALGALVFLFLRMRKPAVVNAPPAAKSSVLGTVVSGVNDLARGTISTGWGIAKDVGGASKSAVKSVWNNTFGAIGSMF